MTLEEMLHFGMEGMQQRINQNGWNLNAS